MPNRLDAQFRFSFLGENYLVSGASSPQTATAINASTGQLVDDPDIFAALYAAVAPARQVVWQNTYGSDRNFNDERDELAAQMLNASQRVNTGENIYQGLSSLASGIATFQNPTPLGVTNFIAQSTNALNDWQERDFQHAILDLVTVSLRETTDRSREIYERINEPNDFVEVGLLNEFMRQDQTVIDAQTAFSLNSDFGSENFYLSLLQDFALPFLDVYVGRFFPGIRETTIAENVISAEGVASVFTGFVDDVLNSNTDFWVAFSSNVNNVIDPDTSLAAIFIRDNEARFNLARDFFLEQQGAEDGDDDTATGPAPDNDVTPPVVGFELSQVSPPDAPDNVLTFFITRSGDQPLPGQTVFMSTLRSDDASYPDDYALYSVNGQRVGAGQDRPADVEIFIPPGVFVADFQIEVRSDGSNAEQVIDSIIIQDRLTTSVTDNIVASLSDIPLALTNTPAPVRPLVQFGNDSDQLIEGASGNDVLVAGLGRDTLSGGEGDDFLVGISGGNNLLLGGSGDDVIVAGTGDTADGGPGFDTLILSEENATVEEIIIDESEILNGNPNQSGSVRFSSGRDLEFSNFQQIICFTPGTLIDTDKGPEAVERLRSGDHVLTRDRGYQPLVWTGRRDLSRAEMTVMPALAPVRIAAGTLGPGLPARDLMVSPRHRMLVSGGRVEALFGAAEVLVAATDLLGLLSGVSQPPHPGQVSYIHIMCARHEILRAEGAWSESFQPNSAVLSTLERAVLAELTALFPALGTDGARTASIAARPVLRSHEVQSLFAA